MMTADEERKSTPENCPRPCLTNNRDICKSWTKARIWLSKSFLLEEMKKLLPLSHLLGGLCWGSFNYSYVPAVCEWTRKKDVLSCNNSFLWEILERVSHSVPKEKYNQTGRIPDWCSLNNPPLEMMFDVGKTQPPLMKRAFSTEK